MEKHRKHWKQTKKEQNRTAEKENTCSRKSYHCFFINPLGGCKIYTWWKKTAEVNRTDIAGYRNIKEKIRKQFILTKKKRTVQMESIFSHQKMKKL